MIDISELNEHYKDIKVLYIESDTLVQEATVKIFKQIFSNIDSVNSGVEALNLYSFTHYDLIISDINLPSMNALELVQSIRKEDSSQRIILMSSKTDANFLLESINLGVDGYLSKPLIVDELANLLQKVDRLLHIEKVFSFYKKELEKEISLKTAKLSKQLMRDDLTQLLNRRALKVTLQRKKETTMILINIDNFDSINSSFGYTNADILLQAVAEFLENRMMQNSSLYYIGADEYVYMLYGNQLQSAEEYINQLNIDLKNHKFTVGSFYIKITVSVGIVVSSDELLKKAHIALKEARLRGKNTRSIFSENSYYSNLQSRIKNSMPLLQEAIEKRYITPYFQPIIDNKTGKVYKYESLARIVNSSGEVYSPAMFIEVAEHTKMIPEITKIMIEKSFAQFSSNELSFSINISELDLKDEYLIPYIEKMLKLYSIRPKRVILEVLEGISADGVELGLRKLKELKSMGFSIAIDDFGTENSNFERVHQLNVDFIKIDGKFIKDIDINEKSFTIAKSITEFAHSIGTAVIAEFVCSKGVLEKVKELGIEYSQGYYFYEPQSKMITTQA